MTRIERDELVTTVVALRGRPRRAAAYRFGCQQLLEAYRPLIAHVVYRYLPRAKHHTVDDLMQEGSLGFLHALEKFRLGAVPLSTYATWWVTSYVDRALLRGDSAVHVPIKRQEARGGLRQPTLEQYDWQSELEVVGELGMSESSPEAPRQDRDRTVQCRLLLYRLSDRDRLVLELRARDHDVETVARNVGCTPKNVQQIEARSIAKLRSMARENRLQEAV
jgi:RNA polymerase sigma factor (sigma-70 family)